MSTPSVLIDSILEKKLQAKILPELEKGRKDFDRPHTEAVVFWMKELLKNLDNPKLNAKILITAAYAHDWGYIGLFDGVNSSDPQEIAKRKPLHMERGAELIGEFLMKDLNQHFSAAEIQEVQHLVLMHDRVEDLVSEEEKLIMEADTLGMLDTDKVKPTFSKEDNQKFITNEVLGRRFKYFLHEFALETGQKLLDKRLEFYSK